HSWLAGEITPLIDTATARELVRVLAYPKFQLDDQDIEALLGDFLPYADMVRVRRRDRPKLPLCADRQDQKFLELAAAGRADALVTGDEALLRLGGRTDFQILRPIDLRSRLGR
ncbi:MAG: putative toxin-antitoxin system toxin component, PIN family, partial [Gemmatimonadota bacterium]